MKLSNLIPTATMCALSLVTASALAAATPLTIVNASFESDTVFSSEIGSTGWSTGVLSGWDVTGETGVWNPRTPTYFPGGIPDGINVAFSNGGNISQTLSAVLDNSTRYSLSVAVGTRTDVAAQNYSIELLAGGVLIASISNPVTPPSYSGTFQVATLNFTSGESELLAGQALGIRFVSGGPQVDYDNVTLSAENLAAVPEPTSYAMLLAGLGLMGALVRRRRS